MAFMDVALGAIGIGIVIMVGYIVVASVRNSLPVATYPNGTEDVDATAGQANASTIVAAGLGLLAVSIIVIAAYGLINVFR